MLPAAGLSVLCTVWRYWAVTRYLCENSCVNSSLNYKQELPLKYVRIYM